MCSDPMIRSPLSGCCFAYSARTAINPGISCSASRISLRPHSASDRSLTLNSSAVEPFLLLPLLLPTAFTAGLLNIRVIGFLFRRVRTADLSISKFPFIVLSPPPQTALVPSHSAPSAARCKSLPIAQLLERSFRSRQDQIPHVA